MKKSRGFILIEMLLALSIALIVLSTVNLALSVLSKAEFSADQLQNQIGIVQLRRHLFTAYDFVVEEDSLNYWLGADNYTLRLVNNRLIQQPGTLIFLVNIEECEFSQEEEVITLRYVSQERNYEEDLAYAQ